MKRPAFTLIELMVVVSIIGILSSLAVVSTVTIRARGRDAQRKSDLDQVRIALLAHYNAQSPSGFFPCVDRTLWALPAQTATNGTSFSGCGNPSASYISQNGAPTADATDYQSEDLAVEYDGTNLIHVWSGGGILATRLVPNYLRDLPQEPRSHIQISTPPPLNPDDLSYSYFQYGYCSYHNTSTGVSYAILAANSLENPSDSQNWKTGDLCDSPITSGTSMGANLWRYRILVTP